MSSREFVEGSSTSYELSPSRSPSPADTPVDNNDHNRNPEGKNQHPDCPQADDESIYQILLQYHRQGVTNKTTLSKLLKTAHNITMSPTTVARHLRRFNLRSSALTTRTLPESVRRQLILDELDKDPRSQKGPATIKDSIREATGTHLSRDYIAAEMRCLDPQGFAIHQPGTRKVRQSKLVVLGPHYEWSGDGHDKLLEIGFPIWGIRDVWTGVWLGLWVLPNNRLKIVIGYIYLLLIEKLGGMPVQTTTDCGSETGRVFGIAYALREVFSPDLEGLPAHRFLKSVHNTTIERGWLQLRLQWGDNVKDIWDEGVTIYDPTDARQYLLVQWLWPKLIQQKLDSLLTRFNNHTVRKHKVKFHPSGISPNLAMALHAEYGGKNCLQSVPKDIVKEMKEHLGGQELLEFVDREYAERAQAVFDSLNICNLSLTNVWYIFRDMLPLI
ncbi:hypothetical protein M422DRAFT_179437 [Sphaerobolus stellatus SS14]|uniref:Integrase core domain-containing protein n=1 Tax=Sphaerobolus stellatus (strain SS14) TaxID=990650 RepID=A0A0C9VGH9_SPHS4|nr:hypothetical protein M422DRAFT_179437 [Sphaerobolus stellatus SS14]